MTQYTFSPKDFKKAIKKAAEAYKLSGFFYCVLITGELPSATQFPSSV